MPITINNEVYYTTKEVSTKFKVDMETVSRWRRIGKLQCYKIGERKIYYSEKHLELFVRGK